MLTVATGIDRGRVGERLQAALAGLQELHFLKEKQADMVHRALRMDREAPTDSSQLNTNQPPVYAEEQRLEATLTALKQQLVSLTKKFLCNHSLTCFFVCFCIRSSIEQYNLD